MPQIKLNKLGVFGLGVCSGIAIYYINKFYSYPLSASTAFYERYGSPGSFSGNWDFDWDHRNPASLLKPFNNRILTPEEENKYNSKLEKLKPTATKHILLIRHGHYNLKGENDKERYLTELGQKQAQFTADRLKALGLPITKLIKSTMTRAQETGNFIQEKLNGIDVENCCLIEEGAPILPDPPVSHWRPEKFFFQDGARIEAAFRKYFHRESPEQKNDTYTVIVCHANVIRYFVCRALQFPPEAWLRISLNHGSITWLSISPSGRVVLRLLGDSGHIPPEYLSRK